MRTEYRTAIYVAIFIILLVSVPALAAITERVKQDCRTDYQRYCSAYGVGSEALRACMSRSIRKVSRACVNALADAGEISKAQAEKLRKPSSKHATRKRSHSRTHAKR